MQKTSTSAGFENPSLIATPTPTKETQAPRPWMAYAARIHRRIENSLNGRTFGFFILPMLIMSPVLLACGGVVAIWAVGKLLVSGVKNASDHLAQIDIDIDIGIDRHARKEEVEKLTDQKALADIAKNDSEWHVRLSAVRKLTDQTLIADIAKNDSDPGVRALAVNKLTDRTLIADIAKNDSSWIVRDAATEKLTDKTLLTGIAKNDSSPEVRAEAAEKRINPDQTALVDIAKNDSEKEVRAEAVPKRTDKTLIGDITENDSDWYARPTAAKKTARPDLACRYRKKRQRPKSSHDGSEKN
ncbi:MAG: hypothetical protein LBS59_05550 [Puniceicoccales bacterium]|nr:hypothetical protein [Puniceicoccales bacterium]